MVHTDFRQAIRRLNADRSFTLAALATLAICIGANIVIFAAVDCILLRPLPFSKPEQLVTTYNSYPNAGVEKASASLPNYYDRRNNIPGFSKVAAIRSGTVIVGDAGSPERVKTERVSPEFFDTLGIAPARGRFFTEEETEYARSGVTVLTNEYWQNHFHGDESVLGKTLRVDGLPVTIVGVLPPGFRYLSSAARLFFPLASSKEERGVDRRHSNSLQMIARLSPGVSLSQAQAQTDAFNLRQMADDPFAAMVSGAGYHSVVVSLHADHVQEVRPVLLFLEGGVLLLLAIGMVNLVNLLLIRASARAKEFAVRQALGAGRRHVIRDVLAETVLLSLTGGIFGVVIGALGIHLLVTLGTDRLPLGATIALDGRIAAFALVGSVLIGGVLGLPGVWLNLKNRLAAALQTESRSGTASRAVQGLRHSFLVVQVGLAFILLAGAALLGLSLERVLAQSPGFHPDHILTGQLSLPWNNYRETSPRLAFIDRLLVALRAQPGVTYASVSTAIPLGGGHDDNAILVEGQVPAPGNTVQAHFTAGVVGEYWQAMGIPLHEGRFLEDADNHRDARVCVVDQDFAARYWPRGDALGHRIINGAVWDEKRASTIVGVVGRVKHTELSDLKLHGAVYFPYSNYGPPTFNLVIRSAMEPAMLAPALRQIVLKLDPELPLDEVRSMEKVIEESLIARRSPALLAGIFAIVALLLAAVGTYGVLAYAVAQRHREIGVRIALGALPGQISRQFLWVGAKLLGGGLVLGVLGIWALGQLMQRILFGTTGLNFGVVIITAGIMIIVVILASLLPSRSAARISPAEALRSD